MFVILEFCGDGEEFGKWNGFFNVVCFVCGWLVFEYCVEKRVLGYVSF